MAKDVVARSYFRNVKIKGVRVEDGDTVIPDRAYMGCKSLKTVYIPESVKRLGHAIFSDTEGVTVTYVGTERQWRMLSRTRAEKRDTLSRGEWDKSPYYNSAGTVTEEVKVTLEPLFGCRGLVVNCKKDGVKITY